MTSSRILARNTAWNLASQIVPIFVALVAVRILVRGLGEDRFGILMLAWSAIGYFSLFDLGLGRALTQAVSAALGSNDRSSLGTISATTLLLMFLLGLAGAVVLIALTPWLVGTFLKIPDALKREGLVAFYLMAASLPFVVMTAGLRGLLEAHQHFGMATMLRLPYAIFSFVAPVIVLQWTPSLTVIIGALLLGRIALWATHVLVCFRRYDFLRRAGFGDYAAVARLLKVGGWMTVSNIISPVMVSLDRFLIGAMISVAAVTYYVTPYEMVTKLLLIPGAVLGVMFPAFATHHEQDPGKMLRLFDSSLRMLIFVLFPLTLVFVAFAPEILGIWVGKDFPTRSASIMQLLAIGVFVNGPGQVAFAGLQAIARADLAAKLHAVELPLYLVAILVFARTLGLNGVAIAWTLRIVLDTLAMCWLMRRRMPEAGGEMTRALTQLGLLSAFLCVGMISAGLMTRIGAVVIVLVVFGPIAWRYGLRSDERSLITGFRLLGKPSAQTS